MGYVQQEAGTDKIFDTGFAEKANPVPTLRDDFAAQLDVMTNPCGEHMFR